MCAAFLSTEFVCRYNFPFAWRLEWEKNFICPETGPVQESEVVKRKV